MMQRDDGATLVVGINGNKYMHIYIDKKEGGEAYKESACFYTLRCGCFRHMSAKKKKGKKIIEP